MKGEDNPQITQISQMNKRRDPRTYAIIGAAMEVHRQLGCGFLEAVYQEALAVEFSSREIPFLQEVDLLIYYKGQPLNTFYRADFICYGEIIVELKTLKKFSGTEEAQIINYLKATELEVGLLLNFGLPTLQHRRFANSQNKSAQSAQSADKNKVELVQRRRTAINPKKSVQSAQSADQINTDPRQNGRTP